MSPGRRGALAWLAAGAAGLTGPAQAQGGAAYPARMPTLVVPYPAGGASDFVARLIQPGLQRQLGQPLVIENVGGVSGALGIQKVLAAAADGHTLALATPMELVLAPLALSAVKFRPEDLRLAGLISATSVVMLARRDLPAASLDEFLTWAQTHPPTYGSSGIGSLYHLMGEKLAALTGLALTHVPYKGGGQMVNDLAGGQLDIAFLPLAGAVPGMIKEGKVRALGIAQAAAHPLLPEVAPMSRHPRLPGFDFDLWIGLEVPRAVPEAVAQRLHAAMAEVVRDAEVRRGLEGTGSVMARPMTLAETDAFYQREITRYREIARAIQLQPQ